MTAASASASNSSDPCNGTINIRCSAEGIRGGQWRRQFAGRGITLHQADCLIAAATAGIEAHLATGNPADFPMDDITIEHWPVGR